MNFEKKNVEYIPANEDQIGEFAPVNPEEEIEEGKESDTIDSDKNAQNEEIHGEGVEPDTDTNAENDTVFVKSAQNKNYSAPRQDHCFIYRIKKL